MAASAGTRKRTWEDITAVKGLWWFLNLFSAVLLFMYFLICNLWEKFFSAFHQVNLKEWKIAEHSFAKIDIFFILKVPFAANLQYCIWKLFSENFVKFGVNETFISFTPNLDTVNKDFEKVSTILVFQIKPACQKVISFYSAQSYNFNRISKKRLDYMKFYFYTGILVHYAALRVYLIKCDIAHYI